MERWNQEHPDQAVQPGDRFAEAGHPGTPLGPTANPQGHCTALCFVRSMATLKDWLPNAESSKSCASRSTELPMPKLILNRCRKRKKHMTKIEP